MPGMTSGADSVGSNGESHALFQGKHFWLSQNVPQRSRFKELIQQNGGIIRLQEKHADIKLVDHARKNLPPNTFSYQFVEESIRKGSLQDLENYRAGPSAQRPVGATYIPSSGTRVVYTLEDDQILWDWMQQYEAADGVGVGGNAAYQALAEKHPRHTYQSYRDRYRKRLRGQPRPGGGVPQTTDQTTAVSHENTTARPSSHPHSPSKTAKNIPKSTMDADRPEERKRKRSLDDETSTSHSSPKRRTMTPQVTIPTTHQPQSEEPVLQKQPSTFTKGITKETETETTQTEKPEPTTKPKNKDPEYTMDSVFLELPFFPLTPEPEEDDNDEGPEQDIDAWIDDRLRTGKAENDAQIFVALRCTSMDPDLADKVLKQLVAGKDIPDDIPGVWTAEDDKCIEGQDSRGIERVLKKHGSEFFNARWEYLTMARDAGVEHDIDN
ncbi:hypothetical protein ASPWEDRAFT_715736 [Aspergillus wentii DTO 134E9]|uniref:DNA-binding protein RAP1 n=1 Tax=Aspergillus wentii DTO 134E9 TaxID=1073089 RepID=A0A1L9R6E3_ASPWE|nr:uncharacterized protein ASPWEDRAFT_715736 [Aspergillus wentii DTO 134E9]KAI9926837.1 hypothetical protein MW887_003934 [Aspergillus wentii]OJJ30492.1 hypothetical protein ASPWEDRAFT_715736 [Aspergillus wentii DTO 134E9]